MFGPTFTSGRRLLVGLFLLLSASAVSPARNAVAWNFIGLPETGTTGQTLAFSASVTNSGTVPWTGDYFLELRDRTGARLDYAELAVTAPRATKTAAFTLRLPDRPGTYTYHFTALQHGREYFGPALLRTIVVRKPPLEVSLTVEDSAIFVGERTTVRSAAGPRTEVAVHGLEVRSLGGHWQTWADWSGENRDPVASAQPPAAGIYEMRAYAARADDEDVTYSARTLLTVAAIPPTITTQPVGAIVNVGETVLLTVAAGGTEPTFQWRKDGNAVAGATGTTLTLSPAHVVQSGSYDVVVSNSAGQVTSRAAAVLISPLNLPALELEV